MKYTDFYKYLFEHESGGPVTDEIPCEELDLSKIGNVVTDYEAGKEIPAKSVLNISSGDEEIRLNNIQVAKDLIKKLESFEGVRGAKTKLSDLGITTSVVKSVIFGLHGFKDKECTQLKKQLIDKLKSVLKKSMDKDELIETLALRRSEEGIIVVSDLEDRKSASAETFRSKNELKRAGFNWNPRLNSWIISNDKLQVALDTINKINKKPLEVVINTLEDLPEFVMGQENVSKKQELAAKIDGFVTELSNEVDETAASAKIKDFLEFNRKFRRYSITNTFLIYLQKRDATKVAGFRTWQDKFFRKVKKGAKAITIFAPVFYKEKDVDIDDAGLDDAVKQKRIMSFRPVPVFDISDTEPIDERGNVPEEPQWHGADTPNETADKLFEYTKQLMDSMGVKVTSTDSDHGEKGFSAGDHINISSNIPGIGRTATMIHEIAHELMHHGEKSIFSIEGQTREQKELQAESVAYVVLRHYDIPATHQSTYLALWKADKNAVQANLDIIRKVSNFIIDKLDEIAEEDKKKDSIKELVSHSKEDIFNDASKATGTEETFKFYQYATDDKIKEYEDLMDKNQVKEAWTLIRDYLKSINKLNIHPEYTNNLEEGFKDYGEYSYIGNCTDEELINDLFGSVTEFAQIVEEYGDDFFLNGIKVVYDSKKDIHHFYRDEYTNNLEEGFKDIAAAGLLGLSALAPQLHAKTVDAKPHTAVTQTIKSEKLNEYDADIVAATLIGEAGGEGDEGMQAVMNVIMNRTKGNIGDAAKVCLKQNQFSMWNGKQSQTDSVIEKAKKHPKWIVAKRLIQQAAEGNLNDITSGADFYFNPKLVLPKWANKFEKTKKIGNHVFYKHGNVPISKFV